MLLVPIAVVSVVVAEVYIVSKQNKAVKAPKDGGPDKPAKKSTAFLGRWGSSSKLASVPKHDKNSLEMRGFPAGGDVEMTMPEMMNLKTEVC